MDNTNSIYIPDSILLRSRGCSKKMNKKNHESQLDTHKNAKLDTFNWLKDVTPVAQKSFDCVEVRFKNNRKDFYRLPDNMVVTEGDVVAVEASPGHDIGVVSLTNETAKLQMRCKNVNHATVELKKVYRHARQNDIDKWLVAIAREDEAILKCRRIAVNLNLKMKVNDVEYQGDDTKAIFYYTADDRIDFRELIKVLAEEFKVRIEMRQIGIRQEASRVGGIGSCGLELCCSKWLTNFHSVTTSAARVQQLTPNPQKLAGQCGKLKCCLNYEHESYLDALKDFPADTVILKTKEGEAIQQKIDVFEKILWYSYKSKETNMFTMALEQVNRIIQLNKAGEIPNSLEDFAIQKETKKASINLVVPQEDLTRFDSNNEQPRKNQSHNNHRSKSNKKHPKK